MLTLGLLLVGALSSCGGGDAGRTLTVDGERVPASRLNDAVEGLCQARGDAPRDLTGARVTFYDRSHDTLHVIAAALEPRDRAQAARLLEAKEAVEAGLDGRGPQPEVEAALDRLVDVTRASLQRLGIEPVQCPR